MLAAPRPDALERGIAALDRLVPLAAAVRRTVRTLALAALAAGAVIAFALLSRSTPGSGLEWAAAALVLALLAAPGAVLLTFSRALAELLELPARLRSLPATGRDHAIELGRIAGDARRAGRARVRSLPRLLWRLGSATRSSRDLLGVWAPVAALASLPYLALVAAASVAAVAELGLALVAALVLALS
jgi:hypothetical protein